MRKNAPILWFAMRLLNHIHWSDWVEQRHKEVRARQTDELESGRIITLSPHDVEEWYGVACDEHALRATVMLFAPFRPAQESPTFVAFVRKRVGEELHNRKLGLAGSTFVYCDTIEIPPVPVDNRRQTVARLALKRLEGPLNTLHRLRAIEQDCRRIWGLERGSENGVLEGRE